MMERNRMNDFFRKLSAYCESHSEPPDPILYELERETHLKTLAPQMASGPLQGQLLQLLSSLLYPQSILEVGTFTGYATICLARGLAPGGKLITIEANPELAWFGEKYFAKAGLADRIDARIGDALDIIPTLRQSFDLIFLDAGKRDYARYYDLVIDQLNPGGLLIADNVLWSGKVIREPEDKDAQILDEFNQKVNQDPRVSVLMLPIRDGLLIAQKKADN
jgi:caffeoyl-CoA O-methyltransferase